MAPSDGDLSQQLVLPPSPWLEARSSSQAGPGGRHHRGALGAFSGISRSPLSAARVVHLCSVHGIVGERSRTRNHDAELTMRIACITDRRTTLPCCLLPFFSGQRARHGRSGTGRWRCCRAAAAAGAAAAAPVRPALKDPEAAPAVHRRPGRLSCMLVAAPAGVGGCGCNAALYFVAMPQPSSRGARYCDIQAHAPPSALCTAL